jgi:hypothetical protein
MTFPEKGFNPKNPTVPREKNGGPPKAMPPRQELHRQEELLGKASGVERSSPVWRTSPFPIILL